MLFDIGCTVEAINRLSWADDSADKLICRLDRYRWLNTLNRGWTFDQVDARANPIRAVLVRCSRKLPVTV